MLLIISSASRIVCLVLLLLLIFSGNSQATHAGGADLTYKCLGGLLYEIEATFYRDCGGSSEPGNVTITYKSATCSYTRSVLANKVLMNNGMEITFPCASASSTCNGGMTTGMRKWVYRTIITLPSACADWVFSYRICCRNCTVTTIQTPCAVNSEIYVEAKLNNLLAPGNSSPAFNNMPVAFICLGQNFNYNQGVTDIDGDSLSYELITPKISATAEVTWLPPASTQSPLASSTPFTINPVTGDINFTPSAMQIGILAIRVNEFRNGILIGSTIRDMQVYTQNCFNSIPSASGINNSNNYITTTCAGQQLCFNIQTSDPDLSQAVTFSVYNPITGSTVVQTPGNRPSLQFCWTPGPSHISRHPYIFTVTVQDNACPVNGVQTFSYTIYVSGPQATITTIDPDCAMNNGSANVLVSNDPGCTYLWNTVPVKSTANITGLTPGNYSVTVTNLQGCTSVLSAQLNAPVNSLMVSAISSGVISCQSGNIGTASATVAGGVTPYTYLWSNGSTASTLNSLGAGTYIVTVTDANGCSKNDSCVVSSAIGNLVAQASQTQSVSCYGGNNGSIEVSANGGASPYTYTWNNGASTTVNSGLYAGNYTVLVTDANGCTSTAVVAVTQPLSMVSGNFVSSAVNCFGSSDGSLSMTAIGGTTPYSYNWSNGAVSPVVSGLTSGAYTVTITDAAGCSAMLSSSVTQPAFALNINQIVSQPVSCFGGDDGIVEINVTGGESPYSYSWDHGATTALINNLEAGAYAVMVTDANGCTSVDSTTVEQPVSPLLALATVTSNVSCFGGSNGNLDITVQGGTAPYTYYWSNGDVTEDLFNVPADMYSISVTDAKGCIFSTSATVSQPLLPVSITLMAQQILCFNGNNGSVISNVTGAAGACTYIWSTGAISPQLSGLNAGTYTLTVSDVNNCTATRTIEITQPSAPLVPVMEVTQPVNCAGQASGAFSLNVTGGTTPYSYLWSNGTTLPGVGNLLSGTYTVTITDANGCNAIISETINEPAISVAAAITVQNSITCFNGAGGVLTATPSGGTAPYSYLWNTGVSTQMLTGLNAGSYSVTITDLNGCTSLATAVLSQPVSGIALSGEVVDQDCVSGSQGSISLNVSGGAPGYSFIWSNGSLTQNLTNVSPGNYSVIVTDNNGCSASGNYEIGGTSDFVMQASGSTTICTGEMVTLIADSSNGTYQWFYNGEPLNGATGLQFITPAAGVYTVSLMNACGTFMSDEIEVTVKSIGNVSVSNTQIICPPETAQLIATGGNTYEWTPASYITFTTIPDPYVSPLNTTTYSVQITNEWGCKTSLSTEVAVVCDTLLVPTGFSPNNDGVNDGYIIDGIGNYPGNKLWVYNRWGKLVYKAHDYNNSWDAVGNVSGVSMGQKVPSGTYYFILDLNDQSKPRAGYLIIRGG